MAKRKLKKVEIVILVGFVSSALTLVGFWWNNKKVNRNFYLPQEYSGWVMIEYNVADAPPLPVEDGAQQIRIPVDGLLKTSTPLEIGWRKDQFFWVDHQGNTQAVPPLVETEDGSGLYIHQRQYFSRDYMQLGGKLEAGQDTTLADGTEIEKLTSGFVNYRPGQKSLEYFYLSAEPKPLQFNPPDNPRSQALESVESREIKVE